MHPTSDVMVIGIAGGTGSGKTTLVRALCNKFSGDVSVLYHDNYYKSHSDLPLEQRAHMNFDHPDAFDTRVMVQDLRKLKEGESIHCPIYDYAKHTRSDKVLEIQTSKVILVEGILVFADLELRSLMDIKIFVDTDADERILRRVVRDVEERGRTIQSVVRQYLDTVKPMHEQFVEPSKRYADIIVLDGGYNLVALDMIVRKISDHIGGKEGTV